MGGSPKEGMWRANKGIEILVVLGGNLEDGFWPCVRREEADRGGVDGKSDKERCEGPDLAVGRGMRAKREI